MRTVPARGTTPGPPRTWSGCLVVGAVLLAALSLAACGSKGGASSPTATVTVTAPASSAGGSGSQSPTSSPAPGGAPGIIAVTTAGALVKLDPSNGTVTQTLVPSGVVGDQVSVTPDGSTVYFTEGAGCHAEIESVPTAGGNLTAVGPGELPAVSPDGSKLAFTTQPVFNQSCQPNPQTTGSQYRLVIRTLSSGAQRDLPLPPEVVRSQLLPPISNLSWAADNTRIAVSTFAVQDNEGWAVYIVDTSVAKYYIGPGAGVTVVPVTGSPMPQNSYLREGVFLPDGNLFVSRACCGGVPIRNTSRLMWEVSPDGALVHQVAIGFPTLDHTSLASDPTGQWLLYLAGNDLYVSQGGNRPSLLRTGLIAANWQ